MTPFITFIRCLSIIVIAGLVSVYAQAPNPTPSTAGGATGILRAAKKIFIDANTEFMSKDALERELLNHSDFSQLGLMIVLNEKDADLILAVSRKPFTTRFIVTTIDARTKTIVMTCRESSLGGEIEPKLAKCFIKQAKAARAIATETATPKK